MTTVKKVGSPKTPNGLQREEYEKRFGPLSRRKKSLMDGHFLNQLDQCKDDASRRILLGVPPQEK